MSSVMTAQKNEGSPDKRRKYDGAFQAEAKLEISHHNAYYNAKGGILRSVTAHRTNSKLNCQLRPNCVRLSQTTST